MTLFDVWDQESEAKSTTDKIIISSRPKEVNDEEKAIGLVDKLNYEKSYWAFTFQATQWMPLRALIKY